MKPILPVIAWCAALAMLIGAAHELRRERALADISQIIAALPKPQVQRQALTLAEYQAIAKKLPLSGSLTATAAADGMTIKAAGLSDYAAWRLTIDQVLLENSGHHWQISYLCSGKCPEGEAHKAVLVGMRLAGR